MVACIIEDACVFRSDCGEKSTTGEDRPDFGNARALVTTPVDPHRALLAAVRAHPVHNSHPVYERWADLHCLRLSQVVAAPPILAAGENHRTVREPASRCEQSGDLAVR